MKLRLLLPVLFVLVLFSCKKGLISNTSVSGLAWNTALDEPFANLSMQVVNTTDNAVIETITTTAAGSFDYSLAALKSKNYILRMVLEDEHYPWYALATEKELVNGQDNAFSFLNYRNGQYYLNVTNSTGVYDSVLVIAAHSNLAVADTNTFSSDTSIYDIRAEGIWNYNLVYYRDTIDSVVSFDEEIIRKSATLPAGANTVTIDF